MKFFVVVLVVNFYILKGVLNFWEGDFEFLVYFLR